MSGVAVVDHRFADLGLEGRLLADAGHSLLDGTGLDADAALALCSGADAVLVGARLKFDATAISGLGRCRVIVRHGVGVDNVDLDAAAGAGMWVAYVPDYCVDEVAEHSIAMLLALNRRLPVLEAAVREGRWGIPAGLEVHRLSTRVCGVVGFGRIGEAVGRRARALGMRVLAADPARPLADQRAAGAEPVGLDELLLRSDYVTLHAPKPAGGPVLGAAEISTMKPGACIINVARGGLIDEPAMIASLRSGRLGGAALDVAAAEPVRADDPILSAPNVMVTPHAAWFSAESVLDLRRQAIAEALRVLAGDSPLHAANRPAHG